MTETRAPSIADLTAARGRIRGFATRTPLVRLEGAARETWLKLETLQPVGSFKIRGAASALGLASDDELARGVYTASAGNMAQGVAWWARRRGVPCAVVVPDGAPRAKLGAVEALGARVIPVPFERWWQVLVERRFEGLDGRFVHPVSDAAVIAGNGTIGLEILEDLPGVADVYVPWGGGGLSSGIAAALRAAGSDARVIACEVETAAPVTPSLLAGSPVRVERRASFVDGIGSGGVLDEMWPLASALLAGTAVLTIEEIAAAVRRLATGARVVAEGAGAAPVAAATRAPAGPGCRRRSDGGFDPGAPEPGAGPAVCVVSGGGIDAAVLARILAGETPA